MNNYLKLILIYTRYNSRIETPNLVRVCVPIIFQFFKFNEAYSDSNPKIKVKFFHS